MIRILTGKFKNSVIKRVGNVRPTPGIIRKAVMDMFRVNIENGIIGDFFAGSGSFGIEAISNNAKKVIFFENNPEVIRVLRENLFKFYLRDRDKSDTVSPQMWGQSFDKKFKIVKISLMINMGYVS
ncbi:MAG: RsmD family RNA methyltransferase, partial [Planctomycetota bacterium]